MRQPCAICDNDNNTSDICATCKADPVNRDWICQPRWEICDSESLGTTASTARPEIEERAWAPTDLARAVLKAWRSERLEQVERVPYLDKNGVQRGYVKRRVRVESFRQIARALGCSHSYVLRVVRRAGAKR